jgi:hypothetical protein
MKHDVKSFDLWIFHRDQGVPRYLMLHTSQEKADKWFGGGRFWQVPGDFFASEDEGAVEGVLRNLRNFEVEPTAIYASECVYTIYNRRFDALQTVPVFAAELDGPFEIALTWEHAESGWFTAEECHERINFWGLHEGLDRTRTHVTEHPDLPPEFKLWPLQGDGSG